jgi:hypothetical protein
MTQEAGTRLRLLGLSDVASLLGTHKENVRAWFEAGVLPCVRVGEGGEPRVSVRMLEAWQAELASQTVSQRAASLRTVGAPKRPLALERGRGDRKAVIREDLIPN